MRHHSVVQLCTKGRKPVQFIPNALRILIIDNRGRELRHGVAVEVRRPGRVFHDEPAGRDGCEIDGVSRLAVGGGGENGEDAGIRVVVEDAADDAEAREIIFVGVVGTVPGSDVEGGVVLLAGVESACEFGYHRPSRRSARCGSILDRSIEICDGHLEVANVGE